MLLSREKQSVLIINPTLLNKFEKPLWPRLDLQIKGIRPTLKKIRLFKKQPNYINRECKRAKKEYFNSLDIKCLEDNKKFWNTIKMNFQVQGNNKITLVKGNDIISDDAKVAEEFSDLFSNAVKNLNIPQIP